MKSRPSAGSRPSYAKRNLRSWERTARWYERHHAASLRRDHGAAWGVFRVPEQRLRLLDDVRGTDALELGCGAGWWSIALARSGARVVGLDFSAARLAQARERMRRAHVDFPLVRARAERIPYPDRRFDLVLSDYGATTFSDPYRTIPEVSRVLRRGGSFVFAHASPFRTVVEDVRTARITRHLVRDAFGLRALDRRDSIEFQLTYAEWIRLFSESGLAVERLVEPIAPRRRQSSYLSKADQEWARHWPIESIWKLRSVGARRARARPARPT
jgi:ubiquinone/menaquinone biosynthesis C-methylase UbiE